MYMTCTYNFLSLSLSPVSLSPPLPLPLPLQSLLHTILWYSRLFLLLLLTFLYVWNYLVYSNAQSKQLKLLEGINERLQLLLPRREERQVSLIL